MAQKSKKSGKVLERRKIYLSLYSQSNGAMAERLGIGLQNQVQQFDSAWHLEVPRIFGEGFASLAQLVEHDTLNVGV